MRLWVDVTDADGVRQGAGPVVAVMAATINRVLDGVGTWSINASASDARGVALLVHGAYVTIYGQVRGVTRELGGGLITDVSMKDAAGGPLMQVAGPDRMDDLKRASTLIGRQYNDQAVADIADDLAGLAGWTASSDAGMGTTTISFSGESTLKALQTLAKNAGYHLRLAATGVIEFGALGDDTGLRLVQRRALGYGAYANQDIAFVLSIALKRSRRDVVNWVLPLGSKEQDPRVTLEYSTRSSPYTIQSMAGPDGSTLYYLSDAASMTTYSQRQAVRVYSQVEAASSDPADLTAAANALYDAAAAELARASVHQDVYELELVGVTSTLRPGDRVRVVYHGAVTVDGQYVAYMDIDDLFWVLDVSETLGSEGQNVSISVSNVDRRAPDAAGAVAETISKVSELEM